MTRSNTLLAAMLCLVAAEAARASLVDYTGAAYDWVAYNNLTATIFPGLTPPETLPPNVTGFTVDNDRTGLQVPAGTLVDYGTGLPVGVTMEVSEVAPSHYLWVDTTGPFTPHTIFDVLGSSYTGTAIVHNLNSTQLLTFTGLDPSETYTFAGVATAPSQYYGALSSVVLQGADAATNDSILTANAGLAAFPGFGTTATSTFISYLGDDLAMWRNISPGADGTFSVLLTDVKMGSREWAPAFDAIVLAEQVPEPGTLGLLAVGGLALLWRRKK